MPPLSLYSVSLRQDLFCEATREIPLDLGKLLIKGEVFWGGSFSGGSQIVAACATKFSIGGNLGRTIGADQFQSSAAFFTELHSLSIIKIAF
jgi:hypothetical protein